MLSLQTLRVAVDGVRTGQKTKSLALENLKPIHSEEPKIVPGASRD